MINLSKFFINRSIILLFLCLFFMLGGIFSFINLNRNEDPGFKIRTASVLTTSDNLDALSMDNYVSKPIEQTLLSMEEIEDIDEKSYMGQSVIFAHLYENFKEIQPIWDRLRRKVEFAKQYIPDNLNPIVNDEYGDVFGALIGVSKDGADYEELYDITRKIRDEFLNLKTRGKVEIFGAQKEAVYIYFKNAYLSNLKLTPEGIKDFIKNSNLIQNTSLFEGISDFIQIKDNSGFKNLEDIKKTIINIEGKPIELGNIFDVQKMVKKPLKHQVRSNGKDALIVGISLQKNGNILKWGKEIKQKLAELKKKYKEVDIELLALQSDYVKTLTDKFTQSLFQSVFAVVLIVMLILGVKSGIITGGIIFITMFSVFFVMEKLNIGLDKISLSALIISLGILVDNSIVVAQGCLRSREESEEIKNCITDVAGKFQTPLFVVTITTSCAFLPVYLAKSTVSEYTSSLFKVVFITLLFSWFYSVSLLPYLMYKFVKKEKEHKTELPLIKFLKNKTETMLNYPKKVILGAISLFLFSVLVFNFVPKIFFPDSDRAMFEIKLNLKNGTNFKETKKAVVLIENYLKETEGIKNFSSYVGISAPRYVLSSSPDADSPNSAVIIVNTDNYKNVLSLMKKVKEFANKNLLNSQTIVRKIPLGPPYDAPIEIRIFDKDISSVFKYAKLVEKLLSKEKGVYLVKNNWGEFSPVYNIDVNENASLNAGLNPEELFDYLNTYYNGKLLTYYYRGDIKVPVILKGDDALSSDINSISIYSKNKNSIIPLRQIANVKPGFVYSKIIRRNNLYALTVQGWTDEGISANDVSKKIKNKLDKINGINYEFGGILEKSKKGNKSIIKELPAAFFVILFVLVFYFNQLKTPLIISFCALLALTGANIGLFITGSDFGFITFLGYICLIGICMNNGVILVSEVSNYTKEGLIEAAKSRVEPILLTSLTTIGGMLPLWLKNDPMFSTLGIAVIFGLLTSILITLFVLPSVLYLTK